MAVGTATFDTARRSTPPRKRNATASRRGRDLGGFCVWPANQHRGRHRVDRDGRGRLSCPALMVLEAKEHPAVPPGAGDLPLKAFTGELGALNSLSHIIAKRALGIPPWLSDKIASNPNLNTLSVSFGNRCPVIWVFGQLDTNPSIGRARPRQDSVG